MINVYVVPKTEMAEYKSLLPPELNGDACLLIGAYEEETGEICGVLAAAEEEEAIDIAYMYVVEGKRQQGIGNAMLETLQTVACGVLAERICASYLLKSEALENKNGTLTALDACLSENGFECEQVTTVYRAKLGDFNPDLMKAPKLKEGAEILSLSKISQAVWNRLRIRIQSVGERDVAEEDMGDAVYMDIGNPSEYDREASFVYLNEEGEPAGVLLIAHPYGQPYIHYLVGLEHNKDALYGIIHLVRKSYEVLLKTYGQDAILYANTVNAASEQLLRKFTEGKLAVLGAAYQRVLEL